MMSEEAYPEAAAILRDAGWKPHDPWGVYTKGTLVMGFSPDGQHFDVKNWGAEVHGEDYPDDPVEAAQWLVRLRATPLQSEATLEAPVWVIEEAFDPHSEGVESLGHDERPEDANATSGNDGDRQPSPDELRDGDFAEEPGGGDLLGADGAIDADFTESPDLGAELLDEGQAELPELEAPPPQDFAGEPFVQEDDPSGAFIFGDNLHQMRTAAIGLVVQAAIERMPEGIDYALLAELRNFVMGVSENRWPDDSSKREQLDVLEGIERQRRAVERVRDEKVEFLVDASREEIEAFNPTADWP